jgi:predicted aminopeptidase
VAATTTIPTKSSRVARPDPQPSDKDDAEEHRRNRVAALFLELEHELANLYAFTTSGESHSQGRHFMESGAANIMKYASEVYDLLLINTGVRMTVLPVPDLEERMNIFRV